MQAAVFALTPTNATIRNTGTILSKGTTGTDFAIILGGPGTITNTGLIKAPSGIFAEGPVTIKNSGTIKALTNALLGTGIVMYGGGTLDNTDTGLIQGGTFGVFDNANAGKITNAGTIKGRYADIVVSGAVEVANSGLLDNEEGIVAGFRAHITNTGKILVSTTGISIDGGTVLNTGLVSSSTAGIIDQSNDDRITNAATGTIIAKNDAISGGNILNAGLLVGERDIAGVSVTNTGTIDATITGIYASTYADNAGRITATTSNATGIQLALNGTATNTGTIAGYDAGILMNRFFFATAAAAPGIITNAGLITASQTAQTGYFGQIYLSAAITGGGAATITNLATGTIADSAGIGIAMYALYETFASTLATYIPAAILNAGTITALYGIEFVGPGTINNSGIITGLGRMGVDLKSSASIINTGTISAYDAIYAKTATAQIYNAGSIDGTNHIGADFTGTLTNAAGGIITGIYLAANLYGPGAINNAGLLSSNDDGVFLENLLTVPPGSSPEQLYNTGTIYGRDVAIRIQQGQGDTATLTNTAAGLIAAGATGRAAIADYVPNLLSITNAGTITGPTGIEVSGPVTILNTGLILGNGATGNAGITLAGNTLYAPGTIYNAGTITGATGISILSGGLVEDSGTITGTSGVAISFRKAPYPFGPVFYANTLALAPGAVINGTIDLFGTLILGGAEFGTLNNATGSLDLSNLVQPTEILVAAGDRWDLSGTIPYYNASKIFNQGTLLTAPGGTVITGASIFNQGYIGGGATGIGYGARYVDNTGTITGTKTGVQLSNFGSVINSAAGTIAGISLALGETIHNTGAITAVISGTGADSYLDNATRARITATADAISLTGAIGLFNAGYIKGGNTAIAVLGGAITNFGTIIGTKYAISVSSDSNARLILSPTAVTEGLVDLGNGYLQLTAGAIAGTVTNAQFKNIYKTTLAAGAKWDLAGPYNADAVVNEGTIDERPSDHLTIAAVSGTGTIEMPKFLSISAAADTGQKIDFSGTGETLALGLAQSVQATIRSFALGDTIDLTHITLSSISSLTFANNILTLKETTGALTLSFATDHDLATDFFHLAAAGAGTDITLSTASSTSTFPLATPTSLAPLITFGS